MFSVIARRTVAAVVAMTLCAPLEAAEPPQSPGNATPPGKSADQAESRKAEARALLEQAIQSAGAVEDPEDQVFRLCTIASVQSRQGLRDAAAGTLRQARDATGFVQEKNSRNQRLADVAAGMAEIGDVKAALALVSVLAETQQDGAYKYVSEAQTRKGVLEGAAQTAAMIRQPIYRGEAFQRIATAYAERADFVKSQQIAVGIPELSAKARAWATIAVAQLRAGDRAAAEKTLSQATKTTAQIAYDPARPSDHKPAMMAELAGVQAEFGNVDEARQTADAITEADWRDLGWGNIATAQAHRGDIHAALQTVKSIQVTYYRGQAVSTIVTSLAEKNEFAEARKVADSIASDYWQLISFVVLAKAQIRAGERDLAARLMETVLREADRVEDDEHPSVSGLKRSVLYQLAQAQSQAGDLKAASEWIARQPSDIRALAYVGLAEGLAATQPEKGAK